MLAGLLLGNKKAALLQDYLLSNGCRHAPHDGKRAHGARQKGMDSCLQDAPGGHNGGQVQVLREKDGA